MTSEWSSVGTESCPQIYYELFRKYPPPLLVTRPVHVTRTWKPTFPFLKIAFSLFGGLCTVNCFYSPIKKVAWGFAGTETKLGKVRTLSFRCLGKGSFLKERVFDVYVYVFSYSFCEKRCVGRLRSCWYSRKRAKRSLLKGFLKKSLRNIYGYMFNFEESEETTDNIGTTNSGRNQARSFTSIEVW